MQQNRRESGQVMPMVALLMVVIIGMAAFAIDGSNLYSQHRKLQADLDVAVKVAASEMYDFSPSDQAYTSTVQTAFADAGRILSSDGYANTLSSASSITPVGGDYHNGFCGKSSVSGTTITLCNPPQAGIFAGAPNFPYVEGNLASNIGGFFGGVLGLGSMHISVRAVAWHGGFHQPYAVIGLDPTGCSIQVQDSGSAMTVNGSIMADGQSCVKNGTAEIHGHSDASLSTDPSKGTQITGDGGTNTGVPPIVDPYPSLPITPAPSETPIVVGPGQIIASTVSVTCSNVLAQNFGSAATTTPVPSSTYYYFPPADDAPALVSDFKISGGSYYFMPNCDGTPGIYYFSRSPSDMSVSGMPSINSIDSVFILDDQNSTLIKETGQAHWVLNAPTSGLYQGIVIYESRPCSLTKSMTIAGTANSIIDGVIDVPCASLTVTGDSTDNPFVNGVVVGYDVTVAGGATAVITYNPAGTPADKGSVLVE